MISIFVIDNLILVSTDYDHTNLFAAELQHYLKEYREELSEKYTRSTVQKHCILIKTWIEFVTVQEAITEYHQITVAMVNSRFRSYFYSPDPYLPSEYPVSFCKSCLKRFFIFANHDGKCFSDKIMKSL